MSNINKQWEELGKKWLEGYPILSFNCGCGTKEAHKENDTCKGLWFNEKQLQFINSKSPEVLISGGYRSGKTVGMIVKMYLLSMFFPNNRILLGRKTRADLESATLPAIYDIFPDGTYVYRPGPGIIEFPNGSQILLYGLDVNAGGDDTKKASQKIKGLDLGGVFIDQLEEVEQMMYEQLTGRMSRNVPFRQRGSTTNPANFWAYDWFKANPRKGTELIETGMADNKENLPEGFIEEQLSNPELYVKKYVYGEWTLDTMGEGGVFYNEWVKAQHLFLKEPIQNVDGIKIFEEPQKDKTYQIGVDTSDGNVDPCHIKVVCVETGEEVANYSGYVPTHTQVDRCMHLAVKYTTSKKPLVVPEINNSSGGAFVEQFKKVWERIYEREVFEKRTQKSIDKLGFHTNRKSKDMLIESFKNLLKANFVKIRDRETVEEMRVFQYTDSAKQQGAGAPAGFHDDKIMATMLAYWGIKPKKAEDWKKEAIKKEQARLKRKRIFQYI